MVLNPKKLTLRPWSKTRFLIEITQFSPNQQFEALNFNLLVLEITSLHSQNPHYSLWSWKNSHKHHALFLFYNFSSVWGYSRLAFELYNLWSLCFLLDSKTIPFPTRFPCLTYSLKKMRKRFFNEIFKRWKIFCSISSFLFEYTVNRSQ